MDTYFVLDERGEPLEESDVEVWKRWFERADRCIARTAVTQDIVVLTTFSGIDQGQPGRPPLLFQSDVLGGWLAGEQKWHSTRAGALEDHASLVDWCRVSAQPNGGITEKDIT